MTNTELIQTIQAEIERRKNNAETLRERNICIEILYFIDTLEESVKPTNQDELEKEIDKYREEHEFSIPAFQQVARHFAQWGAEHLKQ